MNVELCTCAYVPRGEPRLNAEGCAASAFAGQTETVAAYPTPRSVQKPGDAVGVTIIMSTTVRRCRETTALDELLLEARRCTFCADALSTPPRPIFQASATAKLLIASQAPGARAQSSGVPFDDRSGDRLRDWMSLSKAGFYDERNVAIVPMGFCCPGKAKSGDAPPRGECAPLWRNRILAHMPNLRLTLLVGTHAQNAVLGRGKMSQRVRHFETYLPSILPLPHPSWRSQIWIDRNPWFAAEVVPVLRAAVAKALSEQE
jgi:uracil-DNA glycosylase family 4